MSHHHDLQHIAIIMDGNRRWAKIKNLYQKFGHRRGLDSLKKILPYFIEQQIPYATLFCFSSENWQRSNDEVTYLMELLRQFLTSETDFLHHHHIKVSFIGEHQQLPPDIMTLMQTLEHDTADYDAISLALAISYGAQQELADAAGRIARYYRDHKDDPIIVTPAMMQHNLYAPSFPAVDLLVRTGGEQRISNFLLWQCAYAEMIFSDVLFPDIEEHHLELMITEYNNRKRRFGV